MYQGCDEDTGKTAPAALFANTQWSMVRRAKDNSLTALNSLCLAYRSPLIVWLRCRGVKPEDAEDHTHGFFQHLLRQDFLRGVAREKGRFRTFLLSAFQNYLIDQHKRFAAAKRGGGQSSQSLDETDNEGDLLHIPASDSPAPDEEYDRAWATAILTAALQRLEMECANSGHAALYSALEPVFFADANAPAYSEIGTKLNMTESSVKMAALRIRKRLKVLIRKEILQTVDNEDELGDELRYLGSLFGKS